MWLDICWFDNSQTAEKKLDKVVKSDEAGYGS